jgi:DNA-binding transcriptional regulator LsrR (DeoR family)
MKIEECIGIGRENAVTRTELSARTGFPDRTVRRMIAEARDEGVLILNTGDGYYISNDLREIERQYRMDRSRALSILKRLKTMRHILKDAGVDV